MREPLERERDDLREAIASMRQRSEMEAARVPELIDEAVRRSRAEDAARFIRWAGMMLTEVEAALGRLDAGTFGRCADCDQEIGRARLHALPSASRCLDCQVQFEFEPEVAA